MDKKNFNLTLLPARKENENKSYKRKIDPRLMNVHNGCLCLIISPPRTGKSNLILNLFGNSNFLKNYYDSLYLIGATIKNDPTLRPLVEYYNNCYDYIDDNIINDISRFQMEQDPEDRTNVAVIIDDALSLPNFEKRGSALQKLAGNYRHILGGSNGGGLLIISSQKLHGSIPTSLRCCANVIILGRTSNREQIKCMVDSYGDTFGGPTQFLKILKYCWKEKYNFCCIYIDGSIEHPDPCIYKTFSELVYPSAKFPQKKNWTDEETFDSKNNIEIE